MVDVYHTFFGVAGLALMGHPGLAPVDPAYALPVDVVERIKRRQRQERAAAAGAAARSKQLAAQQVVV